MNHLKPSFTCTVCNEVTSTQKEMETHVQEFHPNVDNVGQALWHDDIEQMLSGMRKICFPPAPVKRENLVLNQRQIQERRKLHKSSHVYQSARNPQGYWWCKICKVRIFRTLSVQHILAKHLKQERYKCPYCDFKSNNYKKNRNILFTYSSYF